MTRPNSNTTAEFKDPAHRDRIIDRIKNLLARANGTPYEAEAATALRMAQEFMSNYGLSMTDVELADELTDKIIKEELTEHADRLDPERWEMLLAKAVSVVFDVKVVRNCHYRGSKLQYIGYQKDVTMAKVVFQVLYVACRAAAIKQYPPSIPQLNAQMNRMRLSFMYGASERLCERAHEEKQTAQAEPTGRYDLVVQEKSTRIDQWVKENMHISSPRMRGVSLHPDAYEAGRTHGNSLDLMNREKVAQQHAPKSLQLEHR